MENYIIELISVAGTFIAAYLGSLWALKNVKKEKYFEERKQIYYELASILPIIDTCITQSDYLQDCQLGGTAENKIVIMEMKLHDAEDRLKIMQESQHTYNEDKHQRVHGAEHGAQYANQHLRDPGLRVGDGTAQHHGHSHREGGWPGHTLADALLKVHQGLAVDGDQHHN